MYKKSDLGALKKLKGILTIDTGAKVIDQLISGKGLPRHHLSPLMSSTPYSVTNLYYGQYEEWSSFCTLLDTNGILNMAERASEGIQNKPYPAEEWEVPLEENTVLKVFTSNFGFPGQDVPSEKHLIIYHNGVGLGNAKAVIQSRSLSECSFRVFHRIWSIRRSDGEPYPEGCLVELCRVLYPELLNILLTRSPGDNIAAMDDRPGKGTTALNDLIAEGVKTSWGRL